MIHALCIIGTRPETIKMAPVVGALKGRGDDFRCTVCVTAQHRKMLDDALAEFTIVPDYDLDVMQDAQGPGHVAASVLAGIDPVLARERPDWVIVQGDTTTTMAAALAAFYQGIRVGHVEAGLRTGDRWSPFPEEVHRRVVALCATLHFAPTAGARRNLLAEGVAEVDIVVTGSTVVDALKAVTAHAGRPAALEDRGERLLLVTLHRRESFGVPMRHVCLALRELARAYQGDVRVICLVHPNPAVSTVLEEELSGIANLQLLPPQCYADMARLMQRAYLILTDSGGLQEEAPALGVPVLVLREVTERWESLDVGAAIVVGTDPARIMREARRLLDDPKAHAQMARRTNPYGDGFAGERIADALLSRGASGHRSH